MHFTRGRKLVTVFLISSLIWLYLVFGSTIEEESPMKKIVQALPGYLVMVFGCYSLFSIGRELSILKDYPEEFESLKNEIQQAQQFFQNQNLE